MIKFTPSPRVRWTQPPQHPTVLIGQYRQPGQALTVTGGKVTKPPQLSQWLSVIAAAGVASWFVVYVAIPAIQGGDSSSPVQPVDTIIGEVE